MAWITVTESLIRAYMSTDEVELLNAPVVVAAGQTNYPLTVILANVVNQVRGYIASNPSNKLGPADTLPDQLIKPTLSILRWDLGGQFSMGHAADLFRGQTRKEDKDDAMALLARVAEGKHYVEPPETDGPEELPAVTGAWGSATNIFGASQTPSSDMINPDVTASITQLKTAVEQLGETSQTANDSNITPMITATATGTLFESDANMISWRLYVEQASAPIYAKFGPACSATDYDFPMETGFHDFNTSWKGSLSIYVPPGVTCKVTVRKMVK